MGRSFLLVMLMALAAWAAGPVQAARETGTSAPKTVLYALSIAPEGERNTWRWRLAREYAAAGLYAEADGVLAVLAADAPSRARSKGFRLLRAETLTALGSAADALRLLQGADLASDPEACLRRLLAEARLGRSDKVRTELHCAEAALGRLPEARRTPALMAAVRAAMGDGDVRGAKALLARVRAPNPPAAGEIAYWRGVMAARTGKNAQALQLFAEAARGANPVASLSAEVAATRLRVRTGAMSPADARARLSARRFAWRGGAAERELLLEIGRLSDRLGDTRAAFAAYGAVAEHLSQDPALPRELTRRFAHVFADGGAALQPEEAFALFWDFRHLAPQGPEADAMLRRLAERLAKLGLDGEAASLLEYQVENRLEGTAKAVVAARLAELLVESGRPERALAVLSETRGFDVPPDTRRSRTYAEAQALIGAGRPADANALLKGDTSHRAAALRGEAAWAARDWPKVVELTGARLKPASAIAKGDGLRDLLRVTVAAAMNSDAHLLASLYRSYAPAFRGTGMAEAFEALAGDPGRVSARSLRAAIRRAAEKAAQTSAGSDA